MDTDFNLDRFVAAQDPVYSDVLAELRTGHKHTHWMWFIFPQLLGLGRSETSRRFGLRDLDEARRYLQHPLLGPRLVQATEAALQSGAAPLALFGAVDCQKFISCMTLFRRAAGADSVFARVLERLQTSDPTTEEMLGA